MTKITEKYIYIIPSFLLMISYRTDITGLFFTP